MNFDNRKLRGRIREILGSEAELGRRLGLPRSAISARLSNRTPFTRSEIAVTARLLELDDTEIGVYFFSVDSNIKPATGSAASYTSAEQLIKDFAAL